MGIEVSKYCVLCRHQCMCPGVCSEERWACVPIDGAVILAPRGVFSVEFDAGEDSLLAADAADKLDDTDHATRDIYGVAYVNVLAVGAHAVCWRVSAYEC